MSKKPVAREIKLADLIADDRNFNAGTEYGMTLLEQSLERNGVGRGVLSDANRKLIAGNKTVESIAEILGEDVRIIEVEIDGKTLLVGRRTDLDLDNDTDGKAHGLAIADNRVSEVNLAWSAEQLMAAEADEIIVLSDHWSDDEINKILGRKKAEQAAERLNSDNPDGREPDGEVRVQPGDMWLCPSVTLPGQFHRLVCGDATNAADVARVLRDDKPLLCATDPPYGVSYDPEWRVETLGSKRTVGEVSNDARVDWSEAFALVDPDILYVWHGGLHADIVKQSLEEIDYVIRNQIIWNKLNFVISRGHYNWQHEPCWYAVKKGAQANWKGGHNESTVWMVGDRATTNDESPDAWSSGHSTQKPVELFEKPIVLHCDPGDFIYEPFAGSGTALVAAERKSAVALAIELERGYCEMILRRMEDLTGEKPVLVWRDGEVIAEP